MNKTQPTMDDKTLAALNGSIAKWEKIGDGTGVDLGTKNCPLCEVFFDGGCVGCPVMAKTGILGCRETPYVDFKSAATESRGRYGWPYTANTPEAKRHARRMLDFLRGLLPKE